MKYSKGYRVKVCEKQGARQLYPSLVGRTGETKDDQDQAGYVVVLLDAISPNESHASRTMILNVAALELDPQQPARIPDEFDATATALGITREQVQQEMGKVFAIPDSAVILDAPGYESLARVLARAFAQAAIGKGAERHAQAGEPFDMQVMQDMARRFGVGSLLGQAFKKSEESQRLGHAAAVRELLGAINYLAGAVIAMERAHHA